MTADEPDECILAHWLRHGGWETVLSYDMFGALETARRTVQHDCPDHVDLLRSASLLETDGAYAFVHAGIDPAKPIDQQDRCDCLAIRRPFLGHDGALSHVVVHGHTVTETCRPEVAPHRIAIDTGAYATGCLTAAVLDPRTEGVLFLMTTVEGTTTDVGHAMAADF